MPTHISAIITIATLCLYIENLVIISLRRPMGNDKLEKRVVGIFSGIQKVLP